MPVFFALPDGVKQTLAKYLEDKPQGTSLKYGFTLQGVPVEVEASGEYVLKNSYIKLNKDVYALGIGDKATIGSGNFGTVKYVRSLSTSNVYVVKIISCTFSDKVSDAISKEVVAAYDLGLYRDDGSRVKNFIYKHYIVMANAGMTLNKLIKDKPTLSPEIRFDLGIKLCWSVHHLHQGLSSRTGTTFAHRDIKPANVAIDKTGTLRLVDFGTASTEPSGLPVDLAGSPAYLPNFASLLNGRFTLKQFDILALKRSLFMPSSILCTAGYKQDSSDTPFNCQMILDKALLQATGLFQYVDTSSTAKEKALRKECYQSDALVLASLLVLARYGLIVAHAHCMDKPVLAYAVLGLYFANPGLSDEKMSRLISTSIQAYALERIVERHRERAQQVRLLSALVALGITKQLNAAMNDPTLLNLLASPLLAVKRATALLWQNDIYDSRLLIRLKDDEELAKKAINYVFDGAITEIQALLTKPLEVTLKKPIEARRFSLPLIGSAQPKIAEAKAECKSSRAPAKKTNGAESVSRVLYGKKVEHSSSLFFAKSKELTGAEHQGGLAARKPWR